MRDDYASLAAQCRGLEPADAIGKLDTALSSRCAEEYRNTQATAPENLTIAFGAANQLARGCSGVLISQVGHLRNSSTIP